MIVLRKSYVDRVDKTVSPGESIIFFILDLYDNTYFDWKVSIFSGGNTVSSNVSSVYSNNILDSTEYSVIGYEFDYTIDVYEDPLGKCTFEIYNNEAFELECCVVLKSF